MEELVYLNGSVVPRHEARISVFDHGFLYGYGIFETMRAYHGQIFRLERHLERLAAGAEAIGIGERLAGLDLAKACRDTLAANGVTEARVRLTVTNGASDALPWVERPYAPTIVITARAFEPVPPEKYERGYKASVTAACRCAHSPIAGVKSVDYLVNVLARCEAAALGLDEALLLDERGCVAEGGNSNVFFVRDGVLVTPSLASGILPGITREVVIELASELDIRMVEEDIPLAELGEFAEAFMTSSIIEVMPLVAVREADGQYVTFGNGKPGKVTRRLVMAYREIVEREAG